MLRNVLYLRFFRIKDFIAYVDFLFRQPELSELIDLNFMRKNLNAVFVVDDQSVGLRAHQVVAIENQHRLADLWCHIAKVAYVSGQNLLHQVLYQKKCV